MVKISNTANSYGLISKSLHWAMALIVAGLFAVGLYMTSLTYYDPLYHTLPWWHKSFGLVVFTLLMLRLLWKITNSGPLHLASHSPLEIRLASITHTTMLALILLICISGYLISTAEGKGIELFGWIEIPAVVTSIRDQADLAGLVHLWLAYGLAGFVLLHAAGALKHHFIDKHNTLKRML